MIADCDHIFLVNVGGDEAVQQRQPGTGAAEESVTIARLGAAGVVDEFGPAIAIAGQGFDSFERNRRAALVEPLHQFAPGKVELQILWLVHDACAIGESHDGHAAAAIVRIGNSACDFDDFGVAARFDEYAPNLR